MSSAIAEVGKLGWIWRMFQQASAALFITVIGTCAQTSLCWPPPHNHFGSPECKSIVPTLFGLFHPYMCLLHYHKPVGTVLHPSTWLFLVKVEINKHPRPQAVLLNSEGF